VLAIFNSPEKSRFSLRNDVKIGQEPMVLEPSVYSPFCMEPSMDRLFSNINYESQQLTPNAQLEKNWDNSTINGKIDIKSQPEEGISLLKKHSYS
jgi:hypothetical protein